MSLTYKSDKNNIPVAIVKGTDRIIYLNKPPDEAQNESKKCDHSATICKQCGKKLKSKQAYTYHITHKCPPQKKSEGVRSIEEDGLMKLPIAGHEILFVSGPPKAGKSYFCNDYAKYYRALNPNNRIILFTIHDTDETLDNDIYIKLVLNPSMLDDKFKLEDFKNSLVIFDDIESSEYPKVTKYLLDEKKGLINSMIKNGRHHNIDVMFVNHDLRGGMKTKSILSNMTSLVIYPSAGTKYHINLCLKAHVGISNAQVKKILTLPSRWICISLTTPQYVTHQGGIYMLD